MKKNIILTVILLILLSCQSGDDKKEETKESPLISKDSDNIPGISTMEKFGTRLSPDEILNRIGDSMDNIPGGSAIRSSINSRLNERNNKKVYIIESIEFNKQGFAINIKGHIETPSNYREYVAKGGLGIPVYEEVPENEFGLIFGRKGNIALRDGAVVKINPLEYSNIYFIQVGSDLYDKITKASVLYQALEVSRTPFFKNMLIELEGMLLNSGSKKALLEGIKKFKEENKNMSEEEVMINFLAANESYLKEIEKSNDEAKERIKNGKELINNISGACAAQNASISMVFVKMGTDLAQCFLDPNPFNIASRISDYIYSNVPKNSNLKYQNLNDIYKYSQYQQNKYQTNLKKNQDLWQKVMNITRNF